MYLVTVEPVPFLFPALTQLYLGHCKSSAIITCLKVCSNTSVYQSRIVVDVCRPQELKKDTLLTSTIR